MKKLVAFILCLLTITAFSGCGKKEDAQKDMLDNEVISQETEKEEVKETENNSLVGTWVVTKTEVYDGPLKAVAEQLANTYYYVGAEYEFTDDGIFKNADGTITSNYSILDDKQILMEVVIGNRSKNVNEYELNGDEFVLYGNYYSDNNSMVPLSRASATYFKRK